MTTPTNSYLNRSTPGVYVTELDGFGPSIVGVATAVPVFIGYTEFACVPQTRETAYNQPIPIQSMAEFTTWFGGAATPRYEVAVTPAPPAAAPQPSFFADYTITQADGTGLSVARTGFTLSPVAPSDSPDRFNLYWQMRLFFANGGGTCYVVSVGSYWAGRFPAVLPDSIPDDWVPGTIAIGDASMPADGGLLVGLDAAGHAIGPTMIVIPEACQLSQSDYAAVASAMLSQAGSLRDRVAILDLPGCLSARTIDDLRACQSNLHAAIAPQAANVSYAVAYAPALNSAAVTLSDLLFTNLAATGTRDNSIVNNILTTQAVAMYSGPQLTGLQGAIASAFPLGPRFGRGNNAQYSVDPAAYPAPAAPTPTALSQWQTSLHALLLQSLPVFAQVEQLIANDMNVAPPSAILAGVWTQNDALRGVWNAPANMTPASVVFPLCTMNNDDQGEFNLPLNGEAINILRALPGRGTVVWGARTLDGNSNDYRYIQVRRTLIYIEQSIHAALQPYVFAANDATTWATVTASISAFLTDLWKQGGLMGNKASDAFSVSCGLGSTMTPQDILDGYMNIVVTLQMIRPAEFIELTFRQKMGN